MLAPYSVTQSARARVIEPNNILSQGLTYHVYDWWSVDLDYRYSRFTSNSVGNFQSLFNGTTADDRGHRHRLAGRVERLDSQHGFHADARPGDSPGNSVHEIRRRVPGKWRPRSRHLIAYQHSAAEISFGYEPSKLFSVRGDFHSTTNGASYTAITPHTQQGARFVVRFHPIEKLSIETEVSVANNKLLTTNFENNIRSEAITVSYSLDERFSIFGGFSYDSYFAQGNILYARGTAPLSDFCGIRNSIACGPAELKRSRRSGRGFGCPAILTVPAVSARSAASPRLWSAHLAAGNRHRLLRFPGRRTDRSGPAADLLQRTDRNGEQFQRQHADDSLD